MVADILGHNDEYLSLPATLANAARRTSDGRTVAYAAASVVIVACALVFRPAAWMAFTAFGACVGSFAGWAIADRELRDTDGRRLRRVFWRALQRSASLLGTAGAVMLLFLLLSVGLGTWKS